MRLIDADALLEYLDKRRTYEVMDGRNKAYGKGVRDAMKDIENAPTIDSIPVEWFTKMIYSCGAQGQINAVAAMNWVLDEWRATKDEWMKEQEA